MTELIIPDFFALKDFRDQLAERGVYSKDPEIKHKAILIKAIEKAARGSTSSLNFIWKEVKYNGFDKDDYYAIAAAYESKTHIVKLKYMNISLNLNDYTTD